MDPSVWVMSEGPARQITLSEFWIDVKELEYWEIEACWKAGACILPWDSSAQDHKVWDIAAAGMSWANSKAYCEWRGKRLPTEAEWEKAARGTDGRRFPWGNDEPTCGQANIYVPGCPPTTGETRSEEFPGDVSPYGVLGMMGNLQEWTADWADEDYYSEAPDVDPPGPPAGTAGSQPYRVTRGTYHAGTARAGRTYRRWWYGVDTWSERATARCVSSVPPEQLDDPLAGMSSPFEGSR
jgi:formylglycine-generating enzyme required for sulfatase activity